MEYSLKNLITTTDASISVVDYIIKTKHSDLLIINKERKGKVHITLSNYQQVWKSDNVYYIKTKEPIQIKINGRYADIDTFEVDLNEDDDLLGFHKTEEFVNYCIENKIPVNQCEAIQSKLVFSPQLANYLLARGFKIIELKKHRINNDVVFVFEIKDGFYKAIDDFRKENLNENN